MPEPTPSTYLWCGGGVGSSMAPHSAWTCGLRVDGRSTGKSTVKSIPWHRKGLLRHEKQHFRSSREATARASGGEGLSELIHGKALASDFNMSPAAPGLPPGREALITVCGDAWDRRCSAARIAR